MTGSPLHPHTAFFQDLDTLDLSSATSFSLDDWDGPVLIVSDAEIEWTVDSTLSSSTGPNDWREPGSSLSGSSSSDK